MRIDFDSKPGSRSPSIALCYSAVTGDNTLGELAECDPKFAEMQRPATHRRQVRNLRHAKPLTGIVAELPVEGQHPHSCQRQYRLALFSSISC